MTPRAEQTSDSSTLGGRPGRGRGPLAAGRARVWQASLRGLFLAALALAVTHARGEDNATGSGEIEAGLQAVDTSSPSAWFERYREVPDGFVLDRLLYGWESLGGDYADLRAANALRLDERYGMSFGRHGRYRVDLLYDRTPHLFSREARTLLSRAGDSGLYTIADSIQADFEALDDTTSLSAGDTAGTATLARDLLGSTDAFDVSLRRQAAGVAARYTPVRGWTFAIDASSERRTGNRALSNGSYIRTATGSGLTHTADTFRVLGLELPEPIEHRTDLASLAGTYARSDWLVGVRADFSQFRNGVDFLTFDNPFRATDFASSTFRNRFTTGRMDLAPDNRAASLTVTGSGSLPGRTRITGSVSLGRHEQDDPFPAYTLNSAISGAAGFDVTDPDNLPARDLDGEVRTASASLVATTRPLRKVSFTGRFRYYEYDNRSRRVFFPGYAAFGESAWRTNIDGNPVESELQSYERRLGEVEASWRVLKPLTLRFQAGREEWDREERSVESADENYYGLAVRWEPLEWLGVRARARVARRDVGDYEKGLEAADLRQFDQAERDSTLYTLDLDLAPGDRVSIGLYADRSRQDFPDSFFGLQEAETASAALDLAWRAAPRLNLIFHLAREDGERDLLSAAKDDTVGGTNIFPSNFWSSEVRDIVDSYGARLEAVLRPDKVTLTAEYSRSRGVTEFDNANPNDPTAGKVRLANAEAFPWEDLESDFQEARLRLACRVREGVTLGVSYLYESLQRDDFAWDILEPYMLGISNDAVTETRRFLLLDSTYGGYSAHVAGVFALFRF